MPGLCWLVFTGFFCLFVFWGGRGAMGTAVVIVFVGCFAFGFLLFVYSFCLSDPLNMFGI